MSVKSHMFVKIRFQRHFHLTIKRGMNTGTFNCVTIKRLNFKKELTDDTNYKTLVVSV